MARPKKWTEEKLNELNAQGYGKGRGSTYKPWISVTDFSSCGRSRRVSCAKTQRVHHLFSDVEYGVFLAAEWSRSVVDIREQFPLNRVMTQTIAHEQQIPHPFYPGTQIPTVMTVDFLLTITQDGEEKLIALNAKRDEEAEDARSLEKLEIQRSYFEHLKIPHHLIYHSQLPAQKLKNIAWIRDAWLKEGEFEPHPGYYESMCSRMGRELGSMRQLSQSLAQYCQSFDERYGQEVGTGLRVARMLMKERALMANLDAQDLAAEPLASFLMTSRTGALQAIGGL